MVPPTPTPPLPPLDTERVEVRYLSQLRQSQWPINGMYRMHHRAANNHFKRHADIKHNGMWSRNTTCTLYAHTHTHHITNIHNCTSSHTYSCRCTSMLTHITTQTYFVAKKAAQKGGVTNSAHKQSFIIENSISIVICNGCKSIFFTCRDGEGNGYWYC